MTIFIDLPQGSDAWLAARAGKITASRAKDARDRLKSGKPSAKCLAYAKQVAVERIAQMPVELGYESKEMRLGTQQEPYARAAYEARTGTLAVEGGFYTSDDGVFGYSSDGVLDGTGLLEVKSLFSSERIVDIVGERDVSDFTDQCYMGMWLLDKDWVDVALWAPALEPIKRELTIVRVDRMDSLMDAFEADMLQFEAMVDEYEDKLRALV